jgi:hypothetical protein
MNGDCEWLWKFETGLEKQIFLMGRGCDSRKVEEESLNLSSELRAMAILLII